MNRPFVKPFLLSVVLLVGACSSPQEVDSPRTDSEQGELEVDQANGDKIVRELSEEEGRLFCDDINTKFAEFMESETVMAASCRTVGGMFAHQSGSNDYEEQLESCEEGIAACQAEKEELGTDMLKSPGDICMSAADRGQCAATVAELEGCYEAILDWGMEPFVDVSQFSCEQVLDDASLQTMGTASIIAHHIDDLSKIGSLLWDFSEIEECRSIRLKCPGI